MLTVKLIQTAQKIKILGWDKLSQQEMANCDDYLGDFGL